MTTVVCDASVLFKLLIEEEDTPVAKSLVSSCHVSAPEIAIAEIGNALWTRVHDGRLKAGDGQELIARFLESPIDLRRSRPLAGHALKISCRLDHPIYDCFYLALAENLDVPLVSADRRFINVVRRSKMRTIEIKLLSEFA